MEKIPEPVTRGDFLFRLGLLMGTIVKERRAFTNEELDTLQHYVDQIYPYSEHGPVGEVTAMLIRQIRKENENAG